MPRFCPQMACLCLNQYAWPFPLVSEKHSAEHFSMSKSRVQVWLDSVELGGKLWTGPACWLGQALKGLDD